MKQTLYDNLYMAIAKQCATMSHAVRSKVGCVVVNDDNILSIGWNGMPSGMTNVCEHPGYDEGGDPILVTKKIVLHAEENAISKIAKSTQSSQGATAYLTLTPCINCAKLLYTSGIKRVVYGEVYRNTDGADFLQDRGLVVEQSLT